MAVLYDPIGHKYSREDGTPLISVTQAIRGGGLSDEHVAQFYTEASRERGTQIHAALEAWHVGATVALDVEHLPYWQQIERFLLEGAFESHSAEVVVADELRGYAGTYDLLGKFTNLPVHDEVWDLLDLKTGTVPRTVGCQVMAYRRCLTHLKYVRRWALQITPTIYRLIPLNANPINGHVGGRIDILADRRDEQLFLAALTVAQWRKSHARSLDYTAV